MTSADPPALPQRIGKYRITRLLGRGAMGVVYEGFDPHIQRAVALKTIHKTLLQGDEGAAVLSARFRNEAQAVGRLSHPGIVAIYEYGEDEQQAYIAMEYVPGQDLGQWLARAGAVPPPQAAALMAQLLAALECAHRAGVWHRDLKPANLLLGADGRLKLGDFGIARVAGVGLTQGLVAIGTPGYMAPEQYRGEDVDQRADLYAAGVLLYRLLTGRQPFSGSAETLMYKTLNEPAPPPSGVSPQPLGAAHDALLARALAKAPAERFQSAQAFAQALAACLGSDAVADPDATVVRPPPPLATANAAGLAAGSAANVGSVAGAALGAGAGVGAGSSPGSQSGATVASSPALPSSWDAAAAQRVERALAQQVGPIARVMLRQAAAHAASLDGLVHALAAQLEPGQRAAFEDAALGGRRATPVPAATAASAAAGPASDGAVVPVSAADLSHALAVMTRRVGPIARILIKRATERSRDRAQWLELLLAGCEEADRAALRRELGEPRS